MEETKCYCGHTTYCDCGPETLEEAFEFWCYKQSSYDKLDILRFGAVWQEQQTIEEVFEWLTIQNYLTDLKETMIKDFNKFKNK
jgi:hypothetical protein